MKENSLTSVVILGNGAAGLAAAQAIREHDSACEITMISNEDYLSYRRPMLTKSIAKIPDLHEILIQQEDWYRQQNIKTLLGKSVISMDAHKKNITLQDGTILGFDKCIYALGAESFIPPVPGNDKSGVFTIRKLTDLWAIRQVLPETKTVVIVGGGVLGLEAAWAFSTAGCTVTVLERSDALMTRQLDSDASLLLGNIAAANNIKVCFGADLQEITGTAKATGVLLRDGTSLPAEMVIFSTGAAANIEIARSGGLTVNRGVVVNEYLETSRPDIYACGDCAEYQGTSYKLWTEASIMGRTAGENLSGIPQKYHLDPPPLIYHGMNTALFAIGENGQHPGKQYQVIKKQDRQANTYEAFYFDQDGLAGVVVIGSLDRFAELNQAVIGKKNQI